MKSPSPRVVLPLFVVGNTLFLSLNVAIITLSPTSSGTNWVGGALNLLGGGYCFYVWRKYYT